MPELADPHAGGAVLTGGVPLAQAQYVMILLHGRGASAADILALGTALGGHAVACLAPEAKGHSWYPNSFMAPIAQNEPWLSSAIARIATLVEQIRRLAIPSSRIAIAGFSQGACLSTEFVARHPARYAAVLAYTGGLVGPPDHDLRHEGHLDGTPVLLSSGDPDPHVPWQRVLATGEQLRRMGAVVTEQRYPGRSHTVLPQEVAAGRAILAGLRGWAAAPD